MQSPSRTMPDARAHAVFRCDASVDIGIGHAMRCLAFAETLRWAGWACGFSVNREASDVVPALLRDDIELTVAEPAGVPDTKKARLAIVDNYRLDGHFDTKLRGQGTDVIVFDDLANRMHDCVMLLDPTPGRGEEHYRALVPNDCRLLLGPRFAIIGDRWLTRRRASRQRLNAGRPVERIIVSMGGTDPYDATRRVLAGLVSSATGAHVDVLIGAGTPHRAELAAMAGPSLSVHVDHPDVAALAGEADLAIGAAGTSSFERALLGLPAILIPLADNQCAVAAAFSSAKAADIVPPVILDDANALGARIASLAGDGDRRAAMSDNAAKLTDGRGRFRLLAALAGRVASRSGRTVMLRLVEAADEQWLLDLQSQEATRRFARHPVVPSAAEHGAWFAAILEDRERLLLIVDTDRGPCGMVRLDSLAERHASFEISIAIDSRLHGVGLARAALHLVRNLAPGADLIATVKAENQASLALFTAAGFQPDGQDRYRSRAA